MTDDTAGDQIDRAAALLLVEEINHRVVNEFAEAISSLSLAARSAGPQGEPSIIKAAARLRSYAEAHRALMPPATAGAVNLGDYVGTLCASLAAAYLADHRVRLSLTADDVWLDADASWRIGLILTELIRNAWRHGLAGRPGTIAVQVSDRPATVCCLVADTGRGNPEAVAGRGRRLIEAIAAELGGVVEWRFSPDGSIARLEAPKPEANTPARLPAFRRHPVLTIPAWLRCLGAGRGDHIWPA